MSDKQCLESLLFRHKDLEHNTSVASEKDKKLLHLLQYHD